MLQHLNPLEHQMKKEENELEKNVQDSAMILEISNLSCHLLDELDDFREFSRRY